MRIERAPSSIGEIGGVEMGSIRSGLVKTGIPYLVRMGFPYRDCTGDEQREMSFDLLLKYIREYVYPYSPYYRKLFKENGIDPARLNTYEDFLRVPITTKEDNLEDPRSFILQPSIAGQESAYDTAHLSKKKLAKYAVRTLGTRYARDKYGPGRSFKDKVRQTALREWFPIHFQASGGTTGASSATVYTYDEVMPGGAFCNASNLFWFIKGFDTSIMLLNVMPGVPHLGFYQSFLAMFMEGNSVFNTFGGRGIATERQVEIASKGDFAVMVGITSYISHWLDVAKKMIDEGTVLPITSFRMAFCAGEPVNAEYAEKIKSQFAAIGCGDTMVGEIYGSTELKVAFYECDTGSKPHVSPEYFFVECLDPETRQPVNYGEPGVFVFSHIGWRGTVFLRYWTGDLVQGGISWDKCRHCGLVMPRLNTPIVRAEHDFTKIKGARVLYLDLQNSVRNVPGVKLFQVVITKENPEDPYTRDWVRVFVTKTEGEPEERLKAEIARKMKAETEISPSEIVFEDYDALMERLFQRTGLKADWLIDERTQLISQHNEETV
jgi:phenylacetate-coenzyme A ligase PaaK-like adenylate-forming protein